MANETTRKRAKRALGPIEEPEASALDGEDLASLKGDIDRRLSAMEDRVEIGIENLEKRVSDSLRQSRGGDSEAVREEITRALEEFEKRALKDLRDARSRGDKQRAGLMERVLTTAGSLSELASPDAWKATWSRFSLRGKSEVVDDYGMDPVIAQRFKPIFDFLYYDYWRVEVRGIKNVPTDGSGLLVSNHSGALPWDGSMIKIAVMNEQPNAREVRFLVEDFAYHFPFLGSLMMRIGGVRADPINAVRLLRHGELVCVFPEGVKGLGKLYKQRYRLQRFGRGGFVRICLDTKAPMIPVAIVGAEEIHPMIARGSWVADALGVPYLPITPTFPWLGLLGLIPLPSKWTITFGEPVEFTKYSDAERKNRILVNKLSQQVRGQIQGMILDQLKERRSVWFG
jgi:1-acyl-sn-glycerol-3-phosphate acyltransferase